MIILIILFAVWLTFSFYKLAVLALINLVVGGMILLRIVHDVRDKKGITLYFLSIAVSTALILFKDLIGLDIISRVLSKFMILESVQIGLLVFVIAQLFLVLDKKINKVQK